MTNAARPITSPIPRPPKAVTIDCWSTLLMDNNAEHALTRRGAALAAIATRLGRDLSQDAAVALIKRAWELHVQAWRLGQLFGPEGAAVWCLAELGLTVTPELVEELADAIAKGTLATGTRSVAGAGEALRTLREAGIATALVCDTGFTPARCVREALALHGLELDHYFFSDEVGTPKPHAPIFLAALAATAARPEEAVHIGDLRRTDIAGARAAGMASVRFAGVHDDGWLAEDCQDEEADAVLRHWADLGPLLGL